jgi:hypothetical protein
LAWAIENCATNTFKYYSFEKRDGDDTCYPGHTYYPGQNVWWKTPTNLARDILFAFRRGAGFFKLPILFDGHPKNFCRRELYTGSLVWDRKKVEKSQKGFLEKIANQIHELTGVKPRIELRLVDANASRATGAEDPCCLYVYQIHYS